MNAKHKVFIRHYFVPTTNGTEFDIWVDVVEVGEGEQWQAIAQTFSKLHCQQIHEWRMISGRPR